MMLSLGGSLRIDALIRNKLYILNNLRDNLSIKEIKVDGGLCNLSNVSSLSLGLNEITLKGCLDNLSTDKPLISLVTDTKIVDKYEYINNANVVSSSRGGGSASLDCSSLNGGEWILVPGNSDLGTSDFCVMKYEAKNDGSGNPISQPAGTPWVYINQTDTRIKCESLGPSYHLITNAEWVTIARNAENNPNNWNTSVVGSGSMWRGHSDNNPSNSLSVTNVSNYYDGTGNSFPSIEKRVLELSNGETIWDLSGNVWEWNNDTFNSNAESSLGQSSSGWYEWTHITGYDYLEPFDSTLNSVNGIGKVYADADDAFPSGTVHGFLRGGGWGTGANAGVFALYLGYAPSGSGMAVGFRCSYSP